MARTRKGKAIPEAAKVAPRCTLARLDELIEEATVDCYNESEQISGFYTMLEENLAVPFKTMLLGVEVVVEKLDLTNNDEIVAVCSRGDKCQRIPILELPLPRRAPAGSEWIDAYRRWAHWDRRASGTEMTDFGKINHTMSRPSKRHDKVLE